MTKLKRAGRWILTAFLVCQLATVKVQAQKVRSPAVAAVSAADPSDTDTTRRQLLTLLRISPSLTGVVAWDPSLLGNQEYVAKTNPELASFLGQHPEIARNPDFYLFADIHTRGANRVEALERRVWTGEPEPRRQDDANYIVGQIVPMLVAFAAIGAIAWLIRVLLSNRRWTRVFRLQTEVHGKLIDRFGSNQEILSYMQTDAGRRFLEAAPISVELQQDERWERWPPVLQRVLMPLTAGIVLTLLGAGLLFLRHSVRGGDTPLLLFGVVALMPGLGCIIAAGITWLLAQKLGLLPGATRNGQ
jgi:hypothetical protein